MKILKIFLFTFVGLLIGLTGASLFHTKAVSVEKNSPENLFHASMYYYGNKDFFADSIKPFESVKPLSPAPRIFIVNQHILAAHLIANQFALSADKNVKTVVLITQNNWNAGEAPIITSRYAWKTPLGDMLPNTDIADSLIQKGLASEEEKIFVPQEKCG